MKHTVRCLIAVIVSILSLPEISGSSSQVKTLINVAQDGTGDFTTIQEAVYAIRDYTPVSITIKVKNGVYREKLVVPSWKCDIAIIGEDSETTIITWNDGAKMSTQYFGDTIAEMGTFRTHTMLVAANDIVLENLTIENGAVGSGQSVALHTEGTRIVVRNCRLLGHQDTLFTGNSESKVYFENCYICGTTDFIFGPATAWFERCTIHSLSNSYITASSTPECHRFGYVFRDCDLTADEGVTKVYLGRPWRAHSAVTFLGCRLGGHITPAGWHNWRNPDNERTARYFEAQCSGEGADRAERVEWSRVLSESQLEDYTRAEVLCGDWWEKSDL